MRFPLLAETKGEDEEETFSSFEASANSSVCPKVIVLGGKLVFL